VVEITWHTSIDPIELFRTALAKCQKTNPAVSQTPQETTHRLDWVEVARGFAAVAVVLYHVARHVEKSRDVNFWLTFFQFGHAGVDLFFVISGFVILHAHYKDLGQPERFAHYLNRRLTRIYPPYWVALALTVAMGALGGSGLPDIWELVLSATLLPLNQEPLLGVAWTLLHEIVFYALFALLIVHRGVGFAVLGAWLLGISAKLFTHVPTWGLPPSLLAAYNLEFLWA
jgi:peptidoglycan/LPS O-acetylase OafA/YrhL